MLLVLCFSVLPNAWAGKASWNKLPPEVQDALIDEVDACGTNVPLFVAKMSGYIHDSQRQYRLAFPLMHERVKEFLKSECRDGNFKEACKDNLAAGCSTDANLNRNSCYAHWLGKLKDDVRVLIAERKKKISAEKVFDKTVLKDPAYAHLTANILLQYCHNWIKNECFDEAVSILDEQISSAALLMSASVDNLSKFMIFNSQCNVRIKKNACNVPKKFKPLNPFDPDKAGYVGMRKVIDKKVGIGEGGKSDLPTTCKDGKECNEQPIKDGQKKVEKKSTKKKGEKENPVPGGKGGTGGNKKYNGEEVCSAEEMATIALKPSTIDTQIALFTCDIGNAVVSREDLKIIQRATLRYMLAFANQLYKLENKNETSDHKDMAILSKDFATTQTKLFTELLEMEGATPPAESEFKNLVAYLKNIQTKEDDDIFFEIIAARKHKESEFRQKVCALVTNLEKEVPSTMTYWPREIADCSFDD